MPAHTQKHARMLSLYHAGVQHVPSHATQHLRMQDAMARVGQVGDSAMSCHPPDVQTASKVQVGPELPQFLQDHHDITLVGSWYGVAPHPRTSRPLKDHHHSPPGAALRVAMQEIPVVGGTM